MSDVYEEINLLLYGGGLELVSKANPDGADLAGKDRRKRRLTAGLSAIGATAGAAGLGLAVKETRSEMRKAPAGLKTSGRLLHAAKSKKLAAGLIPLEVAGLGGELMATKILHGDTKKKVVKADCGMPPSRSGKLIPTKGHLVKIGARKAEPKIKGQFLKLKNQAVAKSAPVVEISKVDVDKRQVFGWASVVEKNGVPVVDLQGDYIPVEEMEKASYAYVRKSRKAGDMHVRDGENARVVGEMIESFAVTPEKKEALGLPEEMPVGWWVGFQIENDDVWADIKSGKRTGFSVHGAGVRTPV